MAYQVTYGGISFSIPRAADLELLAKFDYVDGLSLWTEQTNWRGPLISRLAIPVLVGPPMPVPGTFYYPTHVSRWGWFIGLATESSVNAMAAAAFPAGGSPVALPFVLQADSLTFPNAGSIQTPMFMLPPRPLGQTLSDLDGLHYVVLVDERYFFQFRTAGPIHEAELVSWDVLINLLADALGIQFTFNALGVYLAPEPDSDLYTNYESAAQLLDSVCWNLGGTPVRAYDGTYSLRRWAADSIVVSGAQSTFTANQPNPPFDVFGGNILNPTANGNPVNRAWGTVLPQSVTVTFPCYQDGAYYDPERNGFFVKDSYGYVYAVEVLLSSLGAPYSSFQGFVGTKVLEDTAKACFASDQDPATDVPQNAATLTALAVQLATDYYSLLLNGVDELFAGVRAWTPDGVNDIVVTYRQEDAPKFYTRVMRKPWNWSITQLQHATTCT